MPAFATLTLNGLSGADHVFAPYSIDAKGVATFIAPRTSPVGDEKLTVGVRRSTNGGKNVTELRMSLPKVQDVEVNGITKATVVRTGLATLTISTDATAPSTDRDELVLLLRSVISDADGEPVVSLLTALKPFY